MSTITLENRDAWLAERKNGLGASDVSAALGINPWKSAFSLWAEKCGLLPDEDLAATNEAVRWGLALERPIAEQFAEQTGRKVIFPDQPTLHVHDEFPFLRSSLDSMTEREDYDDIGSLEIKTTSAWNADDWANGSVPLYYQTQVQTQLAVCGYHWGTICVLIGGQRMVWRDMDRDDEFIGAMLPHLERFWQHVIDRTPPEIDGSLVTSKVLAKLHPDDNGQTVEAPGDAAQWALELANVKEKLAVLEEMKTLNENRLKAAIGDATFMTMPDGSKYSYKTTERAGYEVKPAKYRTLRKLKG